MLNVQNTPESCNWKQPSACRYGYHISKTSYFLCYDPPTIKRIFERLRNFEAPHSYPKFCGVYNILHVRDVTTGYDSSQPNKQAVSYEVGGFFFFSGEVLLWKRLKVQHAKNSAEGWTASSEQAVWSPSATTTASAHSLARKLLQSAIADCCID